MLAYAKRLWQMTKQMKPAGTCLTTSRLAKTLTPASPERSALMARVRRSGTASERAVRRIFRDQGIRPRVNVATLPGKPDIVVSSKRLAVFIHGCFWHRHKGCNATTTPKTNQDFWDAKFLENMKRDRRNARALRQLGFTVLVIWECQTKSDANLKRVCARIASGLRNKT